MNNCPRLDPPAWCQNSRPGAVGYRSAVDVLVKGPLAYIGAGKVTMDESPIKRSALMAATAGTPASGMAYEVIV